MIRKYLSIALCAIIIAVSAGCGKNSISRMDEYPSVGSEVVFVETNSMSFKEIGETLAELGITIDDETLAAAEKNWNSIPPEALDSLNKVGLVLSSIGIGDYNIESGVFTPSSDKLYCFDLEFEDTSCMFDIFFQGIMSINNDEFRITDFEQEEASIDELEKGIYNSNIKFSVNEHEYSYSASMYYDWFDTNIIKYINEVLEKEGNFKRLYYMVESQICEVFYCTDDWAKEFAAKTGCELSCK